MAEPAPPLGSVDHTLDALQPRPRLTVSEWADAHRVIAAGTSPEPGPWRTARAPYLRGMMDALNEPGVETVAIMIASQAGKTEVVLNLLGYYVDQDPAPILLVQPNIDVMESFSKERIEATFRASPALRGKFDTGLRERGASRKSSETIRLKMFAGGYLAMAGANAPSGLASRPIRIVLCDEVDRFPESSGVEGDPVKLARQRTSNFHNRKIILVSTPTIDGLSKIQREHAVGDRRQYHVPCPHCGALQVLQWERLHYKNEAGEREFAQAHYVCEHCKARIDERHKLDMLAAGEWIAQTPGGSDGTGKVVSFGDLSALYSPWVSWSTMAAEWCKAHDERDRHGLKEFVNLRLGQPFVEHEQSIGVDYLERRREYYGETLSSDVCLLTAGVDVQDDRLELEIVGWGRGRESWGVQYLTLMGDPGKPEVWQLLDGQLVVSRETDDGRRLSVITTCVDSGGHYTSEVYEFCRAREQRRVWAIKGKGGPGVPVVSKPTRNNRIKAALFHVGVDDIKAGIMAALRLDNEGPGYCHFPREPERKYGAEFFSGLLSEKWTVVQRGGKKRAEWKKLTDRNEPLDCRVYATAALEILSPNLELMAGALDGGEAAPTPAKKRGRRMLSRGVG